MTVRRITTPFASNPQELALDVEGAYRGVYIGVAKTPGGVPYWTLVTLDALFTALSEELGKRITVADVEIVPAVVTVKNEVVYGG